jgi:hypothetical protein
MSTLAALQYDILVRNLNRIAFYRDTTSRADVTVVYLWSLIGLAVTGLFFALGFGAEIGQALAAAG